MPDTASAPLSLRKKRDKPKSASDQIQDRYAPKNHDPMPDTHYDGPPALQRSDPSTASLRVRTAAQSERTADLVKRRYSTRMPGGVTDLSSLVGPLPALPTMPSEYMTASNMAGARHGYDQSQTQRGRGINVDMRALRDPTLLPEQYVASILADADDVDIMTYQTELKKLQNRTSVNLAEDFQRNRHRFIQISKEADGLKTEMKTLQALMSDLTAALHQATTAVEDHESSNDRKRGNRSSVANLEALWTSQLQTLWRRVEGSQKYLPAIPGRHVVSESGRWVELNAATWKPRRRVHLILLNDHLLVASEKRRNDSVSNLNASLNSRQQAANNSQSVLVAERCWPLSDVTLADIAPSSSAVHANASRDERNIIANAINLRAGTESWTFSNSSSTDGKAEKAALLVAFRKSVEDLRRSTAAEHGERQRAMDELAFLTGKDTSASRALISQDPLARSESDSTLLDRTAVLVEVDGRPQNLRWIESQIDVLDMDIAMQQFETAVAGREKLKKVAEGNDANDLAKKIILAKLDERAARLAAVILKSVRSESANLTSTKECVGWLIRLGYEESAKTGFLDARSDIIKLRTRSLPFTGALEPHITALSYVTFTLILHTFRVFTASFPTPLRSAVVRWASDRVQDFNASLKRQLDTIEPRSEQWNTCIEIVKTRAAVLAEVGVDFGSLVARGLDDSGEKQDPQSRKLAGVASGTASTAFADATPTASSTEAAKTADTAQTLSSSSYTAAPRKKIADKTVEKSVDNSAATTELAPLSSGKYEGSARPRLDRKKTGGSRSRERTASHDKDRDRDRVKDRDRDRDRDPDRERDRSVRSASVERDVKDRNVKERPKGPR